MRIRLSVLVATTMCAGLSLGATCSATASFSLAKTLNNGQITIGTMSGTFVQNGVTVEGSGITVTASGGQTIKKLKVKIYTDRNGNGKPDPGEVYHEEEIEDTSGTGLTTASTGSTTFDVGSTDPPPRLNAEVETTSGIKVKVDIGVKP